MADAQGEMRFWFNGLPCTGVNKSGNNGGEMQFWFNGLPYQFPAMYASTTVATQNPKQVIVTYQPLLAQ